MGRFSSRTPRACTNSWSSWICRRPRKGAGKPPRMDLRVIGCHGGETPKHRTSAFLLDDDLTLDAGSLTSGLDLAAQCKLEACLISHAHLDHIRDLATLADNRVQNGCKPLLVAATKGTIR